ncbi:class III lanthionine synthetase LanKC N-terminal domain-containing protein [Streptomyces sp. NPDC002537]
MEPGRTAERSLLVDCLCSVLSRHEPHEWRIRTGDFWCHVRLPEAPSRIQGWKLRVSATPLSAPLVLAQTAEILAAHRCPFKFAGTLARVAELCSRGTGRSSGGKFVTVYPAGDDDWLRALAEEPHRATEGLPGPGILSDRPYRPGSLVHYRFGAFHGVPVLGNEASYEVMLMAPDGSLDRDRRDAWFSPPPWAPRDPFTGQRPEPPAPGGATPRPVRLDDRYVVRHAFTGGVHRATDERDGGEWGPPMALAERLAVGLVGLVELVHREGFVLRDFNPNNVMVTEDHELRLIDLELLARPGERVVHAHTPGYAAPEQAAARTSDRCPGPATDLYGLGAALLHLLTGVDPLVAPDDPPARPYRQRIAGLLGHLCRDNSAARRFAPLVLELLHEQPGLRPDLAEVRRALTCRALPTASAVSVPQVVADPLRHPE